jgi:AdoMet-dependent rRNA methyltransferase SPB1
VIPIFKQFFVKVEPRKPAASRDHSAEIFICCFGFKTLTNPNDLILNNRLILNDNKEISHVESEKFLDPNSKIKDYQNETFATRKPISVAHFIISHTPSNILNNSSQLILQNSSCNTEIFDCSNFELKNGYEFSNKLLKIDHLVSENLVNTKEIIEHCNDLVVLGKKELKHLLRWRMNVRKKLDIDDENVLDSSKKKRKTFKEAKIEIEEKILTEVKEIQLKHDSKIIHDRKKHNKLLKKAKKRIDSPKAHFKEEHKKMVQQSEHLFTLVNLLKTKCF